MNARFLWVMLILGACVQKTNTFAIENALRTEPVPVILANRAIARELSRKCEAVTLTENVNEAVAALEVSRAAEWDAVTSLSVITPARALSDAFDARYGTDFQLVSTPFSRVDPSICGYAEKEAVSNRLLGLMLLP